MTDRAQYDGDQLDEIVAENVGIHIEALDSHNWMLMFTRPATDGKPAVYAHFTVRDLIEIDALDGLPLIQRDPVPTCHTWHDRRDRRHECFVRHQTGSKNTGVLHHKCDCGASKTTKERR
jgi:hypothetical protein